MTLMPDEAAIHAFVAEITTCGPEIDKPYLLELTRQRVEKAFSILPQEAVELFVNRQRAVSVVVRPDTGLPREMGTETVGSEHDRRYIITIYEEHQSWPENRFIAGFIRELGHAAANRPPESRWPKSRKERAEYREKLEHRADAMVWKWGLKELSIAHMSVTYPAHQVERIIEGVEAVMGELP